MELRSRSDLLGIFIFKQMLEVPVFECSKDCLQNMEVLSYAGLKTWPLSGMRTCDPVTVGHWSVMSCFTLWSLVRAVVGKVYFCKNYSVWHFFLIFRKFKIRLASSVKYYTAQYFLFIFYVITKCIFNIIDLCFYWIRKFVIYFV